jgi:hypothetical protein
MLFLALTTDMPCQFESAWLCRWECCVYWVFGFIALDVLPTKAGMEGIIIYVTVMVLETNDLSIFVYVY